MTDPSQSASLFAPLFSSAAMRAAVDDLARLQRILDVESALAEADVGVIPKSAASPIAAACPPSTSIAPLSPLPRPPQAMCSFRW